VPPNIIFKNIQKLRAKTTLNFNLPKIYYISADRGIWRRQFGIAQPLPVSVGIHGENSPTFLFYLKENDEKRFEILRQYVQKLGLDVHDISNYLPVGGGSAITRFIDPQTDMPINLAKSGFGANQLLPLIVQAFYADSGSIFLFEEPEISLHPAVQRTFLHNFTQLMIDEKKQVIMTSHSVYFLDTIRRWIRKQDPILANIRLYTCTREKGETKARLIDWKELIDTEGRDQMPKELQDFFAR
jgi:predicted ATPase